MTTTAEHKRYDEAAARAYEPKKGDPFPFIVEQSHSGFNDDSDNDVDDLDNATPYDFVVLIRWCQAQAADDPDEKKRNGHTYFNQWREDTEQEFLEYHSNEIDFEQHKSRVKLSGLELPEFIGLNVNETKRVNLAGYHFGDGADFSGTKFGDYANLKQAHFGEKTNLSNAKFGTNSDLDGIVFGPQADLSSANFSRGTKLRQAKFDDLANLSHGHFEQLCDLSDSEFGADANLKNTVFSDGVKFINSSFGREADLSSIIFKNNVNLSGITFDDGADLRDTKFGFHANLSEASFGKASKLCNIRFNHSAKFHDITLGDATDLSDTTFSDRSTITRLHLGRGVKLNRVIFESFADFSISEEQETNGVLSETSFSECEFRKGVSFKRLNFSDTNDFTKARFTTPVNFDEVKGLETLDFTGARILPQRRYDTSKLSRRFPYWTTRGDAEVHLRALRAKIADTRNHGFERDLYIAEICARRGIEFNHIWEQDKEPGKKQNKPLWSKLGASAKWSVWQLVYLVFWALSDYGRSLIRPVVAYITLFFTCLYLLYPSLLPDPTYPIDHPAFNKTFDAERDLAVSRFTRAFMVPLIGGLKLDSGVGNTLLCPDQLTKDVFLTLSPNQQRDIRESLIKASLPAESAALTSPAPQNIPLYDDESATIRALKMIINDPAKNNKVTVPCLATQGKDLLFWSIVQNIIAGLLLFFFMLTIKQRFKVS